MSDNDEPRVVHLQEEAPRILGRTTTRTWKMLSAIRLLRFGRRVSINTSTIAVSPTKRLVVPSKGVVIVDPKGASFEWEPRPSPLSTKAGGGKGDDMEAIHHQLLAAGRDALDDAVPVPPTREQVRDAVLAISDGVRRVCAERREPVRLAEDLAREVDGPIPVHRCVDHLNYIGGGSYPYECVVCGKRLCAEDIADAEATEDG